PPGPQRELRRQPAGRRPRSAPRRDHRGHRSYAPLDPKPQEVAASAAELVSIARRRNLSGYVALARPITESSHHGRGPKSSPLRRFLAGRRHDLLYTIATVPPSVARRS